MWNLHPKKSRIYVGPGGGQTNKKNRESFPNFGLKKIEIPWEIEKKKK